MIARIVFWLSNIIHKRSGYQCFCPTCVYYKQCHAETVSAQKPFKDVEVAVDTAGIVL